MSRNKAFKIILFSSAACLFFVCLSFAKTDHREYKSAGLETCQDCHKASGVMSNHGTFFIREHRLLAKKAGNNCTDCHEQSFCLDCHKGGAITPDLQKGPSRRGEYMPKIHRSDYVSIHSIEAADSPQNCYRCHESKFCTDCHGNIRNKGSMNIKSHRKTGDTQRYWDTDHAAEARRNLQSCESCHPDAIVCTKCHYGGSGKSPHPYNWRSIQSRYRDMQGGRNCKLCHGVIPN
jgi:hypothetical protein